MSYSVINQDGVHLCDIPLNVYQVIRRQSLSALWLYWAQSLNKYHCSKDEINDLSKMIERWL